MKSKAICKTLSFFLVLGILISYLPISASAQTSLPQDEIILKPDPKFDKNIAVSNISAKETVFELNENKPAGPTLNIANEVNLILDDGSCETALGLNGIVDLIAINRFSPTADQFPMTLTEVSLYFDDFDDSGVASGQPFKVVIYQNTSGNSNPAVGSELLYQQPATIGSAPGWTVVTLDQPVVLDGPGDVLIGAIFTHKPGPPYNPGCLDRTVSQDRSWFGYWHLPDAPDIPILPPDNKWMKVHPEFTLYGGNWMIRAKGTTSGDGSVILRNKLYLPMISKH